MGVPMATLGWAIEAPGCDGHGARYSMTLRPHWPGPTDRTRRAQVWPSGFAVSLPDKLHVAALLGRNGVASPDRAMKEI
jgi:hypothetical protein